MLRAPVSNEFQESDLLGRADDIVQLVTPSGARVSDARYDQWVAEVSGEDLAALYEDLVVVRRIDPGRLRGGPVARPAHARGKGVPAVARHTIGGCACDP